MLQGHAAAQAGARADPERQDRSGGRWALQEGGRIDQREASRSNSCQHRGAVGAVVGLYSGRLAALYLHRRALSGQLFERNEHKTPSWM